MHVRHSVTCSLAAVFAVAAFTVASPPVSADGILIRNVTLIDGNGGAAVPGTSVLVQGERIAAVVKSLAAPAAGVPTADVLAIDGTGRFLIPGLMDVHINFLGAGAWWGLSKVSDIAAVIKNGQVIDRSTLHMPINK